MVERSDFFMGARVGAHKKRKKIFPKDQRRSFGLEVEPITTRPIYKMGFLFVIFRKRI